MGWRERVDETIASNPEYAGGLHMILRGLNAARPDRTALQGVVSQPWGRKRFDWYDAAALYEVALHLQAGLCVAACIDLGCCPQRDREQAVNQSKLDAIPDPFVAWCCGGSGDDDGRLEWRSKITIVHEMHDRERLVVAYPPSGVPLEIGYTEPETTVFHLVRDGGVARWPYGHESITLLLSTRASERHPVQLERPQVLDGAERLRIRSEMLRAFAA